MTEAPVAVQSVFTLWHHGRSIGALTAMRFNSLMQDDTEAKAPNIPLCLPPRMGTFLDEGEEQDEVRAMRSEDSRGSHVQLSSCSDPEDTRADGILSTTTSVHA